MTQRRCTLVTDYIVEMSFPFLRILFTKVVVLDTIISIIHIKLSKMFTRDDGTA